MNGTTTHSQLPQDFNERIIKTVPQQIFGYMKEDSRSRDANTDSPEYTLP